MDLITPFDIALLRVVEQVTVDVFDDVTRRRVNIASDGGTVRMLIVQDSPETRQMMPDMAGQMWVPDDGYYDFFWVYQSYLPEWRTPPTRRLRRDDEIVSPMKGRIKVMYTYDDFAPAQFGLAVRLPAVDLSEAPL